MADLSRTRLPPMPSQVAAHPDAERLWGEFCCYLGVGRSYTGEQLRWFIRGWDRGWDAGVDYGRSQPMFEGI